MLELLRKNPGGAIPVILRRLKQKDLEWRRGRVERNKQWRDVMANNYHRSLDHISFYFRQQDKRAIAAKTLLQVHCVDCLGSGITRKSDLCLNLLGRRCATRSTPRRARFAHGTSVEREALRTMILRTSRRLAAHLGTLPSILPEIHAH